jgi:hypothetical protein
MTDLEALIERVEGLTGESWLVEKEIILHFDLPKIIRMTSSVDAALAFAKQVLPNFKIKMIDADPTVSASNPDSDARSEVIPHLNSDEGWQVGITRGRAPTLPLAVVLATLKAKSAEQSRPE